MFQRVIVVLHCQLIETRNDYGIDDDYLAEIYDFGFGNVSTTKFPSFSSGEFFSFFFFFDGSGGGGGG